MISLYEQLKQYPEGFAKAMQLAKDKNMKSSIDFILNQYKLHDEWEKMKYEDQESLIDLLGDIYSFGFFGGVSFSLDPDKYLEEENKDDKNKMEV